MSGYKWQSDDPVTGMSSFTREGSGKPEPRAATYKVMRTWGRLSTVWVSGQSKEAAQAIADNLNALANEYGQADEYTVEAE